MGNEIEQDFGGYVKCVQSAVNNHAMGGSVNAQGEEMSVWDSFIESAVPEYEFFNWVQSQGLSGLQATDALILLDFVNFKFNPPNTYSDSGGRLRNQRGNPNGLRPGSFASDPRKTPSKSKKRGKAYEYSSNANRKATVSEANKINDIRSRYRLKPGQKNAAYVEGEIDGVKIDKPSISGKKSPDGTSNAKPFDDQQLDTSPTKRDIENGQTDPDRRAYDSEVKALEEILDNTTPTSSGKIKIVTERDMCGSCNDAVKQFKSKRPNIEVETVYVDEYN